MKKNNKWFSLVEIIVWILITSIILTIWFKVISEVWIAKIKLIDSTNIEKEAFFFSQRLYETIKKAWVLDYEEYFDRKVVWNTSFSSGHYDKKTWFWNFWYNWVVWTSNYWSWYYYCRSWDNKNMSSWSINPQLWCIKSNFNNFEKDQFWQPQRYWEYSFQFIDYNSNADSDLWDEDGDHNIIWDDDDEYLWIWPEAFSWNTNVGELYLISADKRHRTLLRINYKLDPDAPSSSSCTTSDWWKTYSWSWCLWQIEILKLEWRDRGLDHEKNNWDSTEWDWVIDTWLIDRDFSSWQEIVAGSNNNSYWLPLFSDNISVKSFEVYPYPNKDPKLSWKDNSDNINIAPYVRLKIILTPSWKVKKRIKWKIPEFRYSTTISLNWIYSRD